MPIVPDYLYLTENQDRLIARRIFSQSHSANRSQSASSIPLPLLQAEYKPLEENAFGETNQDHKEPMRHDLRKPSQANIKKDISKKRDVIFKHESNVFEHLNFPDGHESINEKIWDESVPTESAKRLMGDDVENDEAGNLGDGIHKDKDDTRKRRVLTGQDLVIAKSKSIQGDSTSKCVSASDNFDLNRGYINLIRVSLLNRFLSSVFSIIYTFND